jgi:hypothetical protein
MMSACEGTITTSSCANTGSAAHESAAAEFEEAASQLEELGHSHEISTDRVHFSREPGVGWGVGMIRAPPGSLLLLFGGLDSRYQKSKNPTPSPPPPPAPTPARRWSTPMLEPARAELGTQAASSSSPWQVARILLLALGAAHSTHRAPA